MIIDWIKSLFHKKPDEIVKLKEIIEKQKQEKEQLQKEHQGQDYQAELKLLEDLVLAL